jgi:hypothetical protein
MIVSLKVLVPTLVGVVTGLVIYAAGSLAKDPDLKLVGFTVIVAAVGHGGLGFSLPHVKQR